MSESKTVKELVVYRIKPDQVTNFLDKGLTELQSCVSGFPGMLGHKTLRSAKDHSIFVDWVEWDSLSSAEKASEKMDSKMKNGELPVMVASFEKVEFFDHFNSIA